MSMNMSMNMSVTTNVSSETERTIRNMARQFREAHRKASPKVVKSKATSDCAWFLHSNKHLYTAKGDTTEQTRNNHASVVLQLMAIYVHEVAVVDGESESESENTQNTNIPNVSIEHPTTSIDFEQAFAKFMAPLLITPIPGTIAQIDPYTWMCEFTHGGKNLLCMINPNSGLAAVVSKTPKLLDYVSQFINRSWPEPFDV